MVIAEVQSITFNEFLPALLGPNVILPYQGYDSTVNPDIATEFSTGGFRLGHSLLAPDVQFLNPNASTKFPAVSLANSFFNPPQLQATGADPILKYLATDNAQEIDNKIVPELQNVGATLAHDSSTNALINRYRRLRRDRIVSS